MQLKPFRIEQYFGKYEFTAKYLLSSSDAESRTIQELPDLEPGAHERLLAHWCGYTESPGAPWLREAIAGIYKRVGAQHGCAPGPHDLMQSDDVLVVAAAEEGIFVLYHALAGQVLALDAAEAYRLLGCFYELPSERYSTGLAQPPASSRQGRSVRPVRGRPMDRPSDWAGHRGGAAVYGFCGITRSALVLRAHRAFGLPLRLFPLALPPLVASSAFRRAES